MIFKKISLVFILIAISGCQSITKERGLASESNHNSVIAYNTNSKESLKKIASDFSLELIFKATQTINNNSTDLKIKFCKALDKSQQNELSKYLEIIQKHNKNKKPLHLTIADNGCLLGVNTKAQFAQN